MCGGVEERLFQEEHHAYWHEGKEVLQPSLARVQVAERYRAVVSVDTPPRLHDDQQEGMFEEA